MDNIKAPQQTRFIVSVDLPFLGHFDDILAFARAKHPDSTAFQSRTACIRALMQAFMARVAKDRETIKPKGEPL